ncbi:PTS glucitol/sorbitol transporter subunit IIA [Alkalihalobacillus sp. CinArs1]|uniref:PTS glucitol/sorbitol transporter subunit IIA n=1 Tax=Alkalihalobacillus sp. CinArs1 TaxID=2995314 RepID=UPI0022DE318F|nr:PTS glucitol/sorbitol transporter subunit IIA [Alkalihalobacillus sp. CinArs1]
MSTTVVKEIGSLVPTFKEDKIVILFGPQAPDELREMSVIHEFQDLEEQPLRVGGTITFDDQSYTIQAVGSKANQNLNELGHISIYFKDELDVLPGAICVGPDVFPKLTEGTVISIK